MWVLSCYTPQFLNRQYLCALCPERQHPSIAIELHHTLYFALFSARKFCLVGVCRQETGFTVDLDSCFERNAISLPNAASSPFTMGIICAQGGQPSVKKNRKLGRSVAKGNEIVDFVPPPHAATMSMMRMSNVGVRMLKNLRSFEESVADISIIHIHPLVRSLCEGCLKS